MMGNDCMVKDGSEGNGCPDYFAPVIGSLLTRAYMKGNIVGLPKCPVRVPALGIAEGSKSMMHDRSGFHSAVHRFGIAHHVLLITEGNNSGGCPSPMTMLSTQYFFRRET